MMNSTKSPSDFPSLETERLLLHPLTREYTDFIFRQFSDPAVTQFLLDEPPVVDFSQAEEIVQFYSDPAGKSHNRWVMIQKTDNQPIGTCGFHKWDKHNCRAEIGYDLSPVYWGQAYMTEALIAVISYGFERMKLNRIEALVYVENTRSIHLLHKLGFEKEGTLRDYFFLNEKFYDHHFFSLLRKEWNMY
jgi:[ribosomal protein S5]-alanine N-acetyltransferase